MSKKPKIPKELRDSMAAQADLVENLKNLSPAELEKYSAEYPELQGILDTIEYGPSAYEDIKIDPKMMGLQMEALAKIKERSEQGLTSQDKLAMEQMLSQTDAAASAREKGMLQDMARRGTLDSGAQLAAMLSGQQSDASNARQKAMQMSAEANARRQQAAQQMSQEAARMANMDYNRQANVASAKDKIAQMNVATRMQKQKENLAAKQAIENQRAALKNQETLYNLNIPQQQFQNELAKLGAYQGSLNTQANLASSIPQRGSTGQLVGTLAGAAIGSMGGPAGAKAGAAIGGSVGSQFNEDGGIIRAENGSLMYRPDSMEAQIPEIFQPEDQTPVMMTPPQREEAPISNIDTPKGLDIFQRKLTDRELKDTFLKPQREEYVTREKEIEPLKGEADIPYRNEFGGMGGSGIKKDSPIKKEIDKKEDEESSAGEVLSAIAKALPKRKSQAPLKLNTNVNFAGPKDVLSKALRPLDQFSNPFAAENGGTYYSEDGDLMYISDGKGGIVDGENFERDRVDAKLNSGEMVLNIAQQQRLMDLIRGKITPEQLGDEDIVEGVPEDYQKELLEAEDGGIALQDGGIPLSPEEMLMYNASEAGAEEEAIELGGEPDEPNAYEGRQSEEEKRKKDEEQRSLAKEYYSDNDEDSEKLSKQLKPKDEVLDPMSEYKKLLKKYEERSSKKSDNSTLKNWAAAADILDKAVSNYDPYYRPFNSNLLGDIEKQEKASKKEDLGDITAMMGLLEKYQKMDASKKSKKSPASIFEKKKMEQLAKSGVEYQTKNRPQMIANLSKINKAKDILETGGDAISGGIVGYVPDIFRSEESISAREAMQSAIQETLRPTLGAQFTEDEGKRIMNLQYNEKMSEKENKKRAIQLENFIKDKIKFSDDLYEYIEKNGSDKGFPYRKYGMEKVGLEKSESKDKTITKSELREEARKRKMSRKQAEEWAKKQGLKVL